MAGIKRRNKELGTTKWKRMRLEILDRDDRICAYCGGIADTVDHIVSRATGGDLWDLDNLVSACKSCNSRKGKKSFFGGKLSTPPVFADLSLPVTHSLRPESPFERPEQA
jgi:hypothetical protein